MDYALQPGQCSLMPLFWWHVCSALGNSCCSSLLSWGACWDQLVEVPLLPSGELRHFICRKAHSNKSAGKKGRIPEWFPEVAKLCYIPGVHCFAWHLWHIVTVSTRRTLCFRYLDNIRPSSALISENKMCSFFSSFRRILTHNLPRGEEFMLSYSCSKRHRQLYLPHQGNPCFLPAGWSNVLLMGQSLHDADTPVSQTCAFPWAALSQVSLSWGCKPREMHSGLCGAQITQGSCSVLRERTQAVGRFRLPSGRVVAVATIVWHEIFLARN